LPNKFFIKINYKSISDLNNSIKNNINKIPKDIDLVVGVPRSGMLAANLIALNLNLNLVSINEFLDNIEIKSSRRLKTKLEKCSDANKVLIVDDSVNAGHTIENIKKLLVKSDSNLIYCCIYGLKKTYRKVDVCLEQVEEPRLFEWNLFHRPFLEKCCVDIDGVLCNDPTDKQNDDGPEYLQFLCNTPALIKPSFKIGSLVTSRLEKYRLQTVEWLDKNQISYNNLYMLDSDAKTRREKMLHAPFKAKIYKKKIDAELFIESDNSQSIKISKLSGKQVLCYSNQNILYPNISYNFYKSNVSFLKLRILNKIKKILN
jgi:uncharacterized HAD superfamily protein/adenine/guanine phosphoribosyltransferase-like PRPP-binding protein